MAEEIQVLSEIPLDDDIQLLSDEPLPDEPIGPPMPSERDLAFNRDYMVPAAQSREFMREHPIKSMGVVALQGITGVPAVIDPDRQGVNVSASLGNVVKEYLPFALGGATGMAGRAAGLVPKFGKVLSPIAAGATSFLGQSGAEATGLADKSSLTSKVGWSVLDAILGRAPKNAIKDTYSAIGSRVKNAPKEVTMDLVKEASLLPKSERKAFAELRSPSSTRELGELGSLPGDRDLTRALQIPAGGADSPNRLTNTEQVIRLRELGFDAPTLPKLEKQINEAVGKSALGLDDLGPVRVREEGNIGRKIGSVADSITSQQRKFVEDVAAGRVAGAEAGKSTVFRVGAGLNDTASMPGVITQAERDKGIVSAKEVLDAVDGTRGQVASDLFGTPAQDPAFKIGEEVKQTILDDLISRDPGTATFLEKIAGWEKTLTSKELDLKNQSSRLKEELGGLVQKFGSVDLGGGKGVVTKAKEQLSSIQKELDAIDVERTRLETAKKSAGQNVRVDLGTAWDVAKNYTGRLSARAADRGISVLPNYTAEISRGIAQSARNIRNAQALAFGDEGRKLLELNRKFDAAKDIQAPLINRMSYTEQQELPGTQRFYQTAKGFSLRSPIRSTLNLLGGAQTGPLTAPEHYERSRLGRQLFEGIAPGVEPASAAGSPLLGDQFQIAKKAMGGVASELGSSIAQGGANPGLILSSFAQNSPTIDQFSQMANSPSQPRVVLPRHYNEVIEYLPKEVLPELEMAIKAGDQKTVTQMVQSGLNLKFMSLGNQMSLGQIDSEVAAKEQKAINLKIANLGRGSIFSDY